MDQNLLVSSGQTLVAALDEEGIAPQIAIWVQNSDTGTWKLWIVPPHGMRDKFAFYRRVADAIANHRTELGDMSASDVQMVPEEHPAMQGIGRFLRIEGIGSATFPGNRFGDYYLPNGIIIRSALDRLAS